MDENQTGMGGSQKTPPKFNSWALKRDSFFSGASCVGIASTQMMWDLYITLHSQHGFRLHIKIVALNHCCFQHQKTKIWTPQKKISSQFKVWLSRTSFWHFLFGYFPVHGRSPNLHLQLPNCCLFHGWKPKKYPVWKGSSSEPTLLILQELEPLIDGLINGYL